jgi:excinuclease ABC subunit C
LEQTAGEVIEAFIPQFYLGTATERDIPREIVVSENIEDAAMLSVALTEAAGKKVEVNVKVRSAKAQWLKIAQQAAAQNLGGFLANRERIHDQLGDLQEALNLPSLPDRIECFDISHTGGQETVASCVVFDSGGALKSEYRRFNINDITPGDDYAAMRQALNRRYTRLKSGEGKIPDLLLIDGGKGQLSQALDVLEELQVEGISVVGVAKGVTRRPGLETLIMGDTGKEVHLPADSSALHLVQRVRDEAHRFAVAGHTSRRNAKTRNSTLEGIKGIGPKRRRELLRYFGGIKEVERASLEDLLQVPSISRKIAEDIYAALHNQ